MIEKITESGSIVKSIRFRLCKDDNSFGAQRFAVISNDRTLNELKKIKRKFLGKTLGGKEFRKNKDVYKITKKLLHKGGKI